MCWHGTGVAKHLWFHGTSTKSADAVSFFQRCTRSSASQPLLHCPGPAVPLVKLQGTIARMNLSGDKIDVGPRKLT